MDITIIPKKLRGNVTAVPSKSMAHRALICAAFSNMETRILMEETNSDIDATVECLNALGARIARTSEGFFVQPVDSLPAEAILACRDSGSTIRFLLPVVGALGITGTFLTTGRLGKRPLSPLLAEMERHGCRISFPADGQILCCGRLSGGEYTIPGNVSSQFVSGLMFAGAVMEDDLSVNLSSKLESLPYAVMTQDMLRCFGVKSDGFHICGKQKLTSPGKIRIEGDWSCAAFFITANALGSHIAIEELNPYSSQGDREIATVLNLLEHHTTISAANIPDLIPVLSIAAAAKNGAVFTDIRRLRLKESDRVQAVVDMILRLGGTAFAEENSLTVLGTGLRGGIVDSCRDHRIAMAAAIASTVCPEPVTILDADSVIKSYPRFWTDFQRLGGHYEQYLR